MKFHGNFKHGKYCKDRINYCIDCIKKGIKNEITNLAKRCGSCGNKKSFKLRMKNRTHRSNKNPNFKYKITKNFLVQEYGKKRKTPQQIANQIGCSETVILARLKEYSIPLRTRSEALKSRIPWERKKCSEETKQKIREKAIERFKKGIYSIWPNKPEKLLNQLLQKTLPKEYKYVGNFKFWIGFFNPDFINHNGQKKIIELYGDYWHNLPDYKKRDKRRLKSYKKYGYKTLIIWEHELKNLDKVISKIMEFNLR